MSSTTTTKSAGAQNKSPFRSGILVPLALLGFFLTLLMSPLLLAMHEQPVQPKAQPEAQVVA